MSDMIEGDLSDELWRRYEWMTEFGLRIVHIDNPVKLYMRKGGNTHRVLGRNGIVHCVPTVGVMGCELQWKPSDPTRPVAF